VARIRITSTLLLALVVAFAVTIGVIAVERPTPAEAAPALSVPIMGPNILTSDQIAAWYNSKHRTFAVPGITVRNLAEGFLREGADERVRGDIAFAQSIVETGYFGYVGSIVKPGNFNFAGMGACDSCSSGRQFPSAGIGVRVQIQDLRNYADVTSRAANLAHPPVPEWYAWPSLNPVTAAHNFDTFYRKGKAPHWNQMGNGNHATSPNYASAVIAVYQNMLTFNGYPAAAAEGADPVGNLEAIQRIPDGVRVKGWTLDPSSDGATPVDVYLNGQAFVRRMANVDRPDVHAQFTSAGPNHGFDMYLPIRGGQVCVYAINIGSGVRNPSLGCRTVPGPAPSAHIDEITRQPDGLHVRGWALDPDSLSPARVDVYANGVGVAHLPANTLRTDVGALFPGYGSYRGFDTVLPGVGGRVCIYAINVGAGGGNPLLGCRNVLGVNPVGRLDTVTHQANGLHVTGWTLDPDSANPGLVDIYANGVGYRVVANQPRPDVEGAYPGYGAARGFDMVVPIAGGQLCAYGVNTGAGANVLLGCKNG
jgi:Mannosyl-glycoprotein endo-beta-N-acetylglucosaminidase